jgi:hypothetical protein
MTPTQVIIIIVILGIVIAIIIKYIIPQIGPLFGVTPPPAPVVPPPAPAPTAPPPPLPVPKPPTPGFSTWVPQSIAASKAVRSKPGSCDEMREVFYGARVQWEASTPEDRDANAQLRRDLVEEMDKLWEMMKEVCHDPTIQRF